MNKVALKYMLQSLEVMEQNFISQLRAMRGLVLSLAEEEAGTDAQPQKKEQGLQVAAEDQLARFLEEIGEGVKFNGVDSERNISKSQTSDQ